MRRARWSPNNPASSVVNKFVLCTPACLFLFSLCVKVTRWLPVCIFGSESKESCWVCCDNVGEGWRTSAAQEILQTVSAIVLVQSDTDTRRIVCWSAARTCPPSPLLFHSVVPFLLNLSPSFTVTQASFCSCHKWVCRVSP